MRFGGHRVSIAPPCDQRPMRWDASQATSRVLGRTHAPSECAIYRQPAVPSRAMSKAHELVATLFEPRSFAKRFGTHPERRADAAPVDDQVELTEKRALAEQVAPAAFAAGIVRSAIKTSVCVSTFLLSTAARCVTSVTPRPCARPRRTRSSKIGRATSE